MQSQAIVATELGARYLGQLCKHFAHKIHVTYSAEAPNEGRIAFTIGTCTLVSDATTLKLVADAANDADLAQVQNVIDRHLERFTFREPLKLDWQRA